MTSKTHVLQLALAAVVLVLISYFAGYNAGTIQSAALGLLRSRHPPTRYFHLLVPITSADSHLCRLLVSAGISGYPDPIFVGWNGSGIYDGAKTHLFKISETLLYLNGLPESMDDDLFLMLDALDVQLQLRPEVLISRYHDLMDKSNERLREQGILGKQNRGAEIKHTVLFGPDKSCSPQRGHHAACWAIPDSPLVPDWAGYHTDTSTFTNRAHYLNSGTILGPVRDIRDMFRAAMDMISWEVNSSPEFSLASDQWYFGEVWGEQEVERTRFRDGNDTALHANTTDRIIPYPHAGKRTEYHITLDYAADLFQLASGYDRYITWMSFNHSTSSMPISDAAPQAHYYLSPQPVSTRIDQFTLPADISASRPPFARLPATPSTDLAEQKAKTWADVMLGTSIFTGAPFPLIHVTGMKALRDRWWRQMWFHPFAKELLRAEKESRLGSTIGGKETNNDRDVIATVRGIQYRELPAKHWLQGGSRREGEQDHGTTRQKSHSTVLGGAWTSHGKFLPFDDLCSQWAEDLYKDYYDWSVL